MRSTSARAISDFEPQATEIYAVYPSRRHLSAKVRLFVDFLIERFSQAQDWSAT